MQEAAGRMAFESAAIYRNCLEQLTWLDRRLHGLRLAEQQLNGVLPIAARRQRTAWLILKGGRLCFSAIQPDREDRAEWTRSRIESVSRVMPDVSTNRLETSLRLIIISWFRKNRPMRQQLIPFDQAIGNCDSILKSPANSRFAA
jgi:hypothetical protein